MPSGFTYKVKDGTITDYKEFLKDSLPMYFHWIKKNESGVFEVEKPYSSRSEELKYSVDKLKALKKMTVKEKEEAVQKQYEKSLNEYKKTKETILIEKKRYKDILSEVKKWKVGKSCYSFKKYMINQLTESLEFDCNGSYYKNEPKKQDKDEWFNMMLDIYKKEIKYYKECINKEKEDYKEVKSLLKDFIKSIK